MTAYRIGEVTRRLGMSADTLRYYEKIGCNARTARALHSISRECETRGVSCYIYYAYRPYVEFNGVRS